MLSQLLLISCQGSRRPFAWHFIKLSTARIIRKVRLAQLMGFPRGNFFQPAFGIDTCGDDKIVRFCRGSVRRLDVRAHGPEVTRTKWWPRTLVSRSRIPFRREDDIRRGMPADSETEATLHGGEIPSRARLVTAIHSVESRVGSYSGYYHRSNYDPSKYGLCGIGWTDSAGIYSSFAIFFTLFTDVIKTMMISGCQYYKWIYTYTFLLI